MADVKQLAPDVWSINLPLPFRLRSINLYLLRGADGYALIDAGIDTVESRTAFEAGIGAIGVDPSDIADVYVTHMHPDHIGMSGRRAAEGARVHIMAGEERRARYVWSDEPLTQWVDFLRAHGLVRESAQSVTDAAKRLRAAVSLPGRFHHIEEGDAIAVGKHALRVVWTPGHSDFHYVLVDDDRAAIFTGDHLLPTITPNIGVYPECRPNPLDDYLRSFARFEDLEGYTVYPAHGEPYAALPQRIHELRLHHRERLQGVWDVVAATKGGACAADVVAHFWGDRLNAHETRFALAEVAAHLEYLRFAEDLSSSADDGVIRYRQNRPSPTLPL